jgi:hypothetical protein
VQLVEVMDFPIRRKRHRDQRHAAEHAGCAEACDEPVDVAHPVEQGNDGALFANRRGNRVHRRIEVERLAGEEDDVEGLGQRFFRDQLR